jgi:hypothetical protein
MHHKFNLNINHMYFTSKHYKYKKISFVYIYIYIILYYFILFYFFGPFLHFETHEFCMDTLFYDFHTIFLKKSSY